MSNPGSDEVTLVCTGEGATSEGEFWEMLNVACLEKLPLLILVEDNGFAISVPVEKQTPGGSISDLVRGFPNLFRREVDGTDFVASYSAMVGGGGLLPVGPRSGAGTRARAPGPIRIRSPTTSGSTRPRPSAPWKRRAIR